MFIRADLCQGDDPPLKVIKGKNLVLWTPILHYCVKGVPEERQLKQKRSDLHAKPDVVFYEYKRVAGAR